VIHSDLIACAHGNIAPDDDTLKAKCSHLAFFNAAIGLGYFRLEPCRSLLGRAAEMIE